VLRLNRLYAGTISGEFYENNRFPAYCYDKLVCGLMDSHRLARDPDAYRILEHTTDTALPHLPGKAIEHGKVWRLKKDDTYTQDESYTIPENLFWRISAGQENAIALSRRNIWMMNTLLRLPMASAISPGGTRTVM